MLYSDAKKRATQTYNEIYNEAKQRLLLTMLLSDAGGFARCRTILSEDYFDDRLRPAVRFVMDYAETHAALPAAEQVLASTGVVVEKFSEPGCHTDYLLQQVEGFCQYKAMELAVLDGVDLLLTGRANEIVARTKAAAAISLMSDLGTNYFADPGARLRHMLDHAAYVPTGWDSVDDTLYGGVCRGELNIFAGSSGSGKSLFLQNLAVNWTLAGYVVLYLSLELHEERVALRFDAMISGRGTRHVLSDIDAAVMLIRNQQRDHAPGTLYIKKLPENGTTVNTLRAYIKEFQIKTGLKPDALLIDYLDLMYPVDPRVDPSNVSLRDKHVSEEIRALMHETNTFGATASQLNRGAVNVAEYDQSHIGGGITKINTADNVIAIKSSAAMKEKGELKLQLLKTRSAASVDAMIELAYHPTTMRITNVMSGEPVDKPLSREALRSRFKAPPAATGGPATHASDTAATEGDGGATLAGSTVMDRIRAKNKLADR